jgi:hypothetical protein
MVLVAVTLTCGIAGATTRYVAQSAGTFSSGSACNGKNAITVATFNATTLSPGDTTYICGTLTAAAGTSNFIQFGQSGSSSSPITLIFDSGAVIQAPYWSGPAIEFGGAWIIIDGKGTGIVQATANGTGLANAQDGGIGLDAGSGCSNCTVQNLTVSNIYVHSCTGSVSSCTDEGGQNTYGIRAVGGSNLTLTGNTVHDAKWCNLFAYVSSSGIQISNNTISNCDHGVVFGDAGAGDTGTGSIFGNDISNMQNWDDAGDYNHHDGVHTWANNTGSSYTVQIYNNYLHGNGGHNFNAWLGIEANAKNSTLFNNTVNMQSNCIGGVGLVGLFSGGGPYASGVGIYNNTIQGNGSSDGCEGIGIQEQTGGTLVKNNIVLNTNTFTYIPTSGQVSAIDHNLYYNSSSGFWCPANVDVAFPTWRSGCTYDANGANSNPNLTSGFLLNSGSPAVGLGANLTSLGITALNSDKSGLARAATGVCTPGVAGCWDAGSYQYQSSTTSLPNPPADLVATVQ